MILACGARQPRTLGVANETMSGVLPALEYLTAATKAVLTGTESGQSARDKHVVVVGNGDTATDCVATALRQGAASVTQLVRRPRPVDTPRVWPYPTGNEKVDYGQEEAAVSGGDPRMYNTTVKELVSDEIGSLRAVVVKTGADERELPAQLLLAATGFSGGEASAVSPFGLMLDERGRLGDGGFRTIDPKIFACGDLRRGASLVVWAIAEGRACARAVDDYLEGYTNL